MSLREITRIGHGIARRFTYPQENPMTLRAMTWHYIQRKIYLKFRRLPAIQVPFGFALVDSSSAPRIAVIIHCFYPELLSEILTHVGHMPYPYRIYISTDTEQKRAGIVRLLDKERIPSAVIRLVPNQGRDIAPKYITFRDAYDDCDYFLHLHSKKSPHTGLWGEAWRYQLLSTLVGSSEIIRANLSLLKDPRLGLVFPDRLDDTLPGLRWGANFAISSELAKRLDINIRPEYCLDYPSGSMFWGKPIAIRPLLDLGLKLEDFQEEKGQLDGCLNHTIERMVMYSANKQGLKGCRVSINPAYPNLRTTKDESMLTRTISACLAAQEQERLKYDKPVRRSLPRIGP